MMMMRRKANKMMISMMMRKMMMMIMMMMTIMKKVKMGLTRWNRKSKTSLRIKRSKTTQDSWAWTLIHR